MLSLVALILRRLIETVSSCDTDLRCAGPITGTIFSSRYCANFDSNTGFLPAPEPPRWRRYISLFNQVVAWCGVEVAFTSCFEPST
jgi:hypothetical protein